MASFYWRGGTAAWTASNAAAWFSPDGGTGVPTSTDDVYFDDVSGTVTVTISGGGGGGSIRSCRNLIMTGFTGTLTGGAAAFIDVYGPTILLSNTGTFDPANYPNVRVRSGSTTNITSLGQTFGNLQVHDNSTVVLQDNLIGHVNTILSLISGTFDANGKDVTMGYFSDNNDSVNNKTLNMGSGTWNICQCGPVESMIVASSQTKGPENAWYIGQPSKLTLNKGTSKLRLIRASDAAGLNVALTDSSSETSIVIHEAGGWPSIGTVLIDNEQIEYSALSGTTLTISRRGANNTVIAAHAEDSAVIRITPGMTTLTSAIPNGTDTSSINVVSTTNYEASGHILIDSEIIRYYAVNATQFGGGNINGTDYPLTRGASSGGTATSHPVGSVVRLVEARNFYGGGKDYNIIDFYSSGGYIWTNFYGGFSAATVQSTGSTALQNMVFDISTYTITNFNIQGTNQQPIYIKGAPWSTTGRSYNISYYSATNPSTASLLPYVDTSVGNFFELF